MTYIINNTLAIIEALKDFFICLADCLEDYFVGDNPAEEE